MVVDKTTIQTGIDTNLADNNVNAITPEKLRQVLTNMNDSYEVVIQSKTSSQRDEIVSPAQGLKIYNSTTKRIEVYSGTVWKPTSQLDSIDKNCSGNPNYPPGLIGDIYYVTADGRIGGASGKEVFVGDLIVCREKNNGGAEASVGTKWVVTHSAGNDYQIIRSPALNIPKAAINQLYTTPAQLIDAPGSGKIIMPVGYCFEYNHDTTQYDSDRGICLIFSGTDVPIQTLCGPLNDFSENDIVMGSQLSNAPGSWKKNAALYVKAMGANPTGGGANSFIRVQVYYKIHTVGINEVILT